MELVTPYNRIRLLQERREPEIEKFTKIFDQLCYENIETEYSSPLSQFL